jgi:general secretion pathway protein L
MKRCILVIEAGPSAILCAAFTTGELEPIEYFRYAQGSLKDSLRLLSEDLVKKELKPVKVLLSIHSSLLSVKFLEIPVTDRRKLQEIISLQSEDLFMKGPESMVLDCLPLPGGKAVVAGVEKEELSSQLKALADAGMAASWAGPALFSKGLLLKGLGQTNGAAAFIDDDSITVTRDGQTCFFKHLATEDDLLLSVSALEADGVKIEKYYSAGSGEFARKARIEAQKTGSGYEHPSLLAVALQMRVGFRDSVNFLRWHADPLAQGALRRNFRWMAALSVVLVLFWGAYTYLRYLNISSESDSIVSVIERGFTEIFPGEKPKNPEYALEVKLKELAAERAVLSGRAEVLTAMLELSKAASKGMSLRTYEAQMSGNKLNISGEAGSFEEAASFRESVSRAAFFKKVTITETKPGPGGRVRFGMSAEMGGL